MRILVLVGSYLCESHKGRKSKGSSTMSISRGLVDPNCVLNCNAGKGIRLIFLYCLMTLKLLRTFRDKQSVSEKTFGCLKLWIIMNRND